MISKQTLSFLRALAVNNNREWFVANHHKYESAKEDFNNCLKQTLSELTKYDASLKGLEALMLRISPRTLQVRNGTYLTGC